MLKRYSANWHGNLSAVVTGLLMTAACPDIDMGWIAWIALVPLMHSLRGAAAGDAFRGGMVAGMAHYLTLICWLVHTMRVYGGLPWYLAVPPLFLLAAYLSLYFGLFAALWSRMQGSAAAMLLAAPVFWTGLEYLRSFLLSGFPWALAGYTQHRYLHLIQISDIFGVYGVSFVIVLCNAGLFMAVAAFSGGRRQGFRVRNRHAVAGLLTVFAAVAGIWVYGAFRIQDADRRAAAAPALRAAVVQGNIDQMVKWNPDYQEGTIDKYLALSRSIDPAADLVVWPETAVPFYLMNDAVLTRKVLDGIRETGAHFVIGSPAFERTETGIDFFNSAYLITPAGRPAGRYDKVHLVPFGEYVPLQQWLPFVRKLVAHVGDFKTGEKGETLPMSGRRMRGRSESGMDLRIGVLICYEIIFPDLSRAVAANGAGLLVNVTNDAWYGRSSAPYQHFSMAVFRAVENKRALVRSANTGISGFIDPVGRVRGATPLFVDAAAVQSVPVLTEKTVYTRTGDWFAAACLGMTIIITLWLFIRRKES